MSEYLLSLIGIILLSAILTAILPEGKTSGLIKSVVRMVCVLAIIAPILNFFQSGALSVGVGENSLAIFSQSGIETDATFINYYSEMRIKETENALNQEIFDRFSVETEVTLQWELIAEEIGGNMAADVIKITKICVKIVKQEDEEVLRKMWEHLTQNYCSEVLIE